MKHWQELGHIAGRVARLGEDARQAGRPSGPLAALAIVTAIEGSSYRRPGAKLLIEPDGSVTGGVSGGCLEEDVRRTGLQVIASGRARVLHYDTGDDDSRPWGLGLGCNGAVDLAVQPVGPDAVAVFAEVQAHLSGDAAFALSTRAQQGGAGGFWVVAETAAEQAAAEAGPAAGEAREIQTAAGAALRARRSGTAALAGGGRLFTEVLLPPPKLLVCGAGDDARPLVRFAAAVGFRVLVADHRPAFLTAQRFPEAQRLLLMRADHPGGELPADRDTLAVIKTHAFEHDSKWLARLLSTEVGYIGLLGPRSRGDRLLAKVAPGQRRRVFAPVGLDLGADGPEQVALSVVSEALAVWGGRSGQHLREREAALHACA
jgi:xanthine dehydrogenase accessory factor